jgi:hypothetical protein
MSSFPGPLALRGDSFSGSVPDAPCVRHGEGGARTSNAGASLVVRERAATADAQDPAHTCGPVILADHALRHRGARRDVGVGAGRPASGH